LSTSVLHLRSEQLFWVSFTRPMSKVNERELYWRCTHDSAVAVLLFRQRSVSCWIESKDLKPYRKI
jgi:hypothetical protein